LNVIWSTFELSLDPSAKIAFVNFCRFNQINVIITGKETDEETVRQLKENGLQVILA